MRTSKQRRQAAAIQFGSRNAIASDQAIGPLTHELVANAQNENFSTHQVQKGEGKHAVRVQYGLWFREFCRALKPSPL